MPEGDTIFRTARALGRALITRPVTGFRSTYPLLTRFDDDTPITGQMVDSVEPRGKWLLIHFSGGGTLATHLLMNGSWHIYRPGERWQQPRANMRIVLENSEYIAVGFRVPVAKMLWSRDVERTLRIPSARIDVLSAEFDAAEAVRRIATCVGEEIADVLLHQEVMAGVGNEFKSEICFLAAINPFARVADLAPQTLAGVVDLSRRLVRANVLEDSSDAVVTYGGLHRRTTHSSDPKERVWVYGRQGEPCRRCGAPILCRKQGPDARVTFWCPECQPMPESECGESGVLHRSQEGQEADSSLTTPKLKYVWGPVRSE
jgi:endonuclease-8